MADGEDSAPQGRVKASVGCGSDHTLKDPHMMGDPTGKRGALLTTRRLQILSVVQEKTQAELDEAIS